MRFVVRCDYEDLMPTQQVEFTVDVFTLTMWKLNLETLGTSYEQQSHKLEIVAVMSCETYMCNLDSVLLLMWRFLDGTKNYDDDENESDNGSTTGID